MEVANQEVVSGIGLVNVAGESFEHIHQTVSEVTTQIQGVTLAVQQVAAGTEKMVQTMEAVNQISGSTAGGMVEVSAATEEQRAAMDEVSSSAYSLAQMAEKLQLLIGKFRV